MYLDSKSLYEYVICETLRTSGFRFFYTHELEDIDFRSKSFDDPKECILEVELKYPPHLHDAHNEYPLAPEKLLITPDLISSYGRELVGKVGSRLSTNPLEKLTSNLRNKANYVVHYRNLQFYLEMGMKLTKIHRVMVF